MRPPPEAALFSGLQARRSPIAKMECGVGQPSSSEQVISLLTRWNMRGFFSDPPSERCDAILKRYCLFGRGTLHRGSPQFGEAGAQSSVLIADELPEGCAAINTIWGLETLKLDYAQVLSLLINRNLSKREQRR